MENCRLPYSRVNTLHLLILMFLGVHDFTALKCAKQKTHKKESFTLILPPPSFFFLFAVVGSFFFFLPRMTHGAPRGEKKKKKAQRCGSSSLNATSQNRRKADYLCTLDLIMAVPPVSRAGFAGRDLKRWKYVECEI